MKKKQKKLNLGLLKGSIEGKNRSKLECYRNNLMMTMLVIMSFIPWSDYLLFSEHSHVLLSSTLITLHILLGLTITCMNLT